MKLVSSASQVREMDRFAIEELGVPGIALMESASRGAAEIIRHRYPNASQICVVCGGGNNGGDGYGVARWLSTWGYRVYTWSLSTTSTADAAVMRAAADKLGIAETEGLGSASLIVDAMFGTGLNRDVTELNAAAIDAINGHPADVVALDIPSGIHADIGSVLGTAVNAQHTVTFARLKPGLLVGEGLARSGRVHVVDIGVEFGTPPHVAEIPQLADVQNRWPKRGASDHKKQSGHLLVVAGSRAMAGAAVLTCRGALAAGAGLISLCVPNGALSRLTALPPEVMVVTVGEGSRITTALPDAVLTGRTAMVAGPGLGGGKPLSEALSHWLKGVWGSSELPMLYDADALVCAVGDGPAARVITPHPGEVGRLLGRSTRRIQSDRFKYVQRLHAGARVALLKGRNTLIARSGTPVSINPTGNPVLATGGSGDVLAGVIGALLARGVPARRSAILGTWVHGRAADVLAERRSQGWSAADVVDALPDAIEELL